MTLQEAINILETAPILNLEGDNSPESKALRLAIEALNLIKFMREIYPLPQLLYLPGETEEPTTAPGG